MGLFKGWKSLWVKLSTMGILLILAVSLTSCASLGKSTVVYLSDRERVYIVKANTPIPVIWADEPLTIQTDRDMVLMDKGAFLRIQQEANEITLK